MNKRLSQQQLAIQLAKISLVLWLISLGLVGVYFLNVESWRGIEIFFWGTPFGWMALLEKDFLNITVYSNVFYLYARSKLSKGKTPSISVCLMTILGVILLFSLFLPVNINPFPMNAAIPRVLPVTSWGWGAILLLFTQALIVLSALLAHQKISVKSAYLHIGLLIFLLLVVGALGCYQRIKANDWEMEHYFPSYDIAFTKQSLSGLLYKPLTEKLLDDATIEIEFVGNISPLITENEDAYPNAYWQNGKFWEKYYSNIFRDFAITVGKILNQLTIWQSLIQNLNIIFIHCINATTMKFSINNLLRRLRIDGGIVVLCLVYIKCPMRFIIEKVEKRIHYYGNPKWDKKNA